MSNRLKILFCEHNAQVNEGCRYFFSDKPVEIQFCTNNGYTLLENICVFQPDVVVCEVFLSGIDAITVKEMADKLKIKPKFYFATCTYDNDNLMRQLMTAKFNYLFIKPYSFENMYERIKSFINISSDGNTSSLLEKRVTDILHEFMIPVHMNGYKYLRDSIILAVNNPEIINSITKKLYPTIAQLHSTTASRVERSIRHAIESGWELTKQETMQKYFHYYNDIYYKPANSRFIACIADMVRIEMKTWKTA